MRIATLLCVLAAVLAAGTPAQAASNACNFSVDDYWTGIDVTLDGTGTVLGDADGRYVAPAEVVPGLKVRLSGAKATVALPAYMAMIGYNFGLLHAGENTIPVKVWIALQASNTREGVQVVGPLSVDARTTITTAPNGEFVSATPIAYTPPTLPDLTWTATGGDVALSQAGPGAIAERLPIGPNGALRAVRGSAVILAALSPVSFAMDCQPGRGNETGTGPIPAAPTPFDTRPGPLNETCLSGLGRQLSGAAADLPAGLNRELDPIRVEFSVPALEYAPGTPLTLAGARVKVTIPAAIARVFGRHTYAGGVPVAVPDQEYPATVWVAIRATGTAESVQTVKLDLRYRLHPLDAETWAPVVLEGALPDTTWTPSANGPIAFSQAPAGALSPLTVTGVSEPDTSPDPYEAAPYGSVFVRLATERYGESLDCIAGAVTAIDPAVPWSNRGRLGPAGRYTLLEHPAPPVFATATVPPPPVVEPTPTAVPGPPPPGPTATPAPTPVPKPKAGTPKLRSTRLAAKSGKVKLQLACSTVGPCAGTLAIRAGGRSLVRARRYTLVAGKPKTYTLALTRDARRTLTRRRSLKVKVTLTPATGKAVTKTLTLRG